MDWLPFDPWSLPAWVYWVSGVLSILGFLASILTIPWIVVRIPHDYFSRPKRSFSDYQGWERVRYVVVKLLLNLVGLVLLIMGLIMFVAPGPGTITILIAVSFLSIPGKRWLLQWIVTRPSVLAWINKIREKNGKQPIEVPK
jgi:cytochrome b561